MGVIPLPAGTAFLAYTGPTGAVLVSTRPAGGSWSVPQPLSSAGSTSPRVAADANGNAVVAWIAATGVLQAAAYDATGPVLPGPAIPNTATVGQALGVSIAPSWDLWSSVASMAWDFGDGTTAAGPSATHAWSRPGTYTVTVSGSDTFGNSTARSGQITVAPQPPQASVSTPVPTPSRGSSGPAVGTTGTVAGVTVRLPGASAAKTPLPTKLSKAALRKLPKLRVSVAVPKRSKKGTKIIIALRLNRPVRGALATVQLRRGVSYRTIARGRVSGRRIPLALSFRSRGRYLLRVRFQESGKGTTKNVVAIVVR
jgi:PKD domain-containing protein